MFAGPEKLRRLMPVLRRLPPPLVQELLAVLAIGDGLVGSTRFHRASAWAAAQGLSGLARRRLALALLANHGRFVAAEAMISAPTADSLGRGVVIDGAEHLHARGDGALLLGFHLGPPKIWLALRALGHPVRFAGRFEEQGDPRWQDAFAGGDAVQLAWAAPGDRAQSLLRIRNLLRYGALVYLSADGPMGREAFRIDLAGGPLVIRAGWLALRHALRVATLPVLSHREGTRLVITIHEPLPDYDGNLVRDEAMCREALTPLLADYVRRFPDQCRYLAFPRW